MAIKTSEQFLNLIKEEALRYLIAGDQHYTSIGSSLEEMFTRFASDEELLIDFCLWALAKRGLKH